MPRLSTARRSLRLAGLVLTSVSWTLALPGPAAAEAAEPRHRDTNVVMLSIDTLRHDHLGCYGYSRPTSPNIDRLAERAVVFDNFISQAVLTPVSQMSILTSQYPRVNGVVSFQPAVDLVTARTLPEILKSYGYTNAAFLSSPEFRDDRYVGAGDETRELFSRSFDFYVPPSGTFRDVPSSALEWLRTHKDEKFFLWLPIGTVHWPYGSSVPAPHKTKFDPPGYTPFFARGSTTDSGMKSVDSVPADILSYIYNGTFYGDPSSPYRLSERDAEFIVARYDAGILHTDMFVGNLTSLLEDLGISGRTLIVLYSTHGEDLGEHGYFGHYDLYDTEAKNALLVKFPNDEHGGMRFTPQVQGIDIVPTILDYLDIPLPHEAQGTTVMPGLSGQEPGSGSRFAYSTRIPLFEYVLFKGRRLFVVATRKTQVLGTYMETLREHLEAFDPQRPPYDVSVRTLDWKLIVRNHAPMLRKISWWGFVSGQPMEVADVELYDLRRDPMEQRNVASEHPEVVAALRERLAGWDASVKARAADTRRNAQRLLIPYP
jgi:arylsulfatase A-like enzyme